MPRIEYVRYRPKPDTMVLIGHCNRILISMADRGYTLTLRQLYYQLVTENLIPNNVRSYNNLKSVVSSARDGGLIDWDHIQDRGRSVRSYAHWDDPQDFIRSVVPQFRIDHWAGQPHRVEVWVEKDALVDVVAIPASRWQVPYFANKGYLSASAAWEAGRRFMRYSLRGQQTIILHLGDHDPSGIDMTRDISERINTYARLTPDYEEEYRAIHGNVEVPDVNVEVRRLALNFDQVEELGLHPNPAKMSDSRAPDYVTQYGNDSWELDAIPVERIDQIIDEAVASIVDRELYESSRSLEAYYNTNLRRIPSNWFALNSFLNILEDHNYAASQFLSEFDYDDDADSEEDA